MTTAILAAIAEAMGPGASPTEARKVLELLSSGQARLGLAGESLVIWWYPGAGVCEIVAVQGSLADADAALELVGRDMWARGAPRRLEWCGRRGWHRIAERMS